MPVYSKPPSSDLIKPVEVSNSDIVSNNIKTNLINTKNIPLESIIANIRGSAWAVNYYFQVISDNDTPAPIDLSTSSITTQLRRVTNQELRVTEPLSYTPNNETHENETTGSANIVCKYKPNIGDIFIAGVRDGYEGIFTVTEVHPLASFEKTGYSIVYSFYDYVDSNAVLYDAIEDAVVSRYTYTEEYGGRREAILDSDLTDIVKLKEYISYYTRTLAENFLDKDSNILFVPDQEKVYDKFLTSFIRKTTDISESHLLRMMHTPIVDETYSSTTETILDAVIGRSVLTFKTCKKNMVIIPSINLRTSLIGNSAYHNGVGGLVYPKDQNANGQPSGVWPQLKAEVVETHSLGLKFYIPNRDGFYIFSEYFYTEDLENMSVFELMISDVIKSKKIAASEVLDLFDDLLNKDPIFIFYYAPIICIVAKMIINRY